jgi:hypothetical protein
MQAARVSADSTNGLSVTNVAADSVHGLSVTVGGIRPPPSADASIEEHKAHSQYLLALLGMTETEFRDMFESWRANRHWGTLVCVHCQQPLDDTEPVVFAYEEGNGSSAATLHLHCADAAMPSMAQTNRWLKHERFILQKNCVDCHREMFFGHRLGGLAEIKNSCTPYCGQQHRLRQTRVEPQGISCASCLRSFLPRRRDAITCSNACRQRLHRLRKESSHRQQAA